MLVFSKGFGQWQCQEGVWRADVNARDVNATPSAISHSYLKAEKPVPGMPAYRKYGLEKDIWDGSIRLYRSKAFSQYAQCIHDYSVRTIRKSGEVLDACAGILSILGSRALLDTEFLHGLPCTYIDSALLWHSGLDICRRTGDDAPPSWSWAGWELPSNSPHSRQLLAPNKESDGPRLFYRTPFEVHFDTDGLKMNLTSNGEERMRPLAAIYRGPQSGLSRVQLGLLGARWMQNPANDSAYQSWEFNRFRNLPVSRFLNDSDLRARNLSDKHLVIDTEEAFLYLGGQCSSMRAYTPDMKMAHPDFVADSIDFAADEIARERWLYADEELQHKVGVATHCTQSPHESHRVRAILLSEAQYLGNEKKPDVLGYPLYNIMLIEEASKARSREIHIEGKKPFPRAHLGFRAGTSGLPVGSVAKGAMEHLAKGRLHKDTVESVSVK